MGADITFTRMGGALQCTAGRVLFSKAFFQMLCWVRALASCGLGGERSAKEEAIRSEGTHARQSVWPKPPEEKEAESFQVPGLEAVIAARAV